MALRNPDKKILIISTDPAHNTSDAFDMKFGPQPTAIPSIPNLSVMENDVKDQIKKFESENAAKLEGQQQQQSPFGGILPQISGMMKLMTTVPGMDEALAFSGIVSEVKEMKFDIVIFDTAPTGHTLKFLSLPSVMKQMLEKVSGIQSTLGPLFSQIGPMLGMDFNMDEMKSHLDGYTKTVEEVNKEFTNPDLTTFIPVLIPEFLPLYETERLLQELMNLNMDANSIIVNQILPPNDHCEYCKKRTQIQTKYLGQIDMLYGDFHLLKIKERTEEVRGLDALKDFGKNFEASN